jgi:hypothetical protein
MRNLWKEEGAKGLREEMEGVYGREAKAVGFRIPEFADKEK